MPVPIINPAGPLAAEGLYWNGNTYVAMQQAFARTGGDPVTDWVVDGGVLTNETANGVTWTYPNRSGIWHLTAQSASGPTIVQVTIVAVLPRFWDRQTPKQAKKNVLMFEPYDGPDQSITKGGRRLFWECGHSDVDEDQFNELFDFWDWHHPGKEFWVDDPKAPRSVGKVKYKTDSDLDFKDSVTGPDSYDVRFRLKQAWPYGV